MSDYYRDTPPATLQMHCEEPPPLVLGRRSFRYDADRRRWFSLPPCRVCRGPIDRRMYYHIQQNWERSDGHGSGHFGVLCSLACIARWATEPLLREGTP